MSRVVDPTRGPLLPALVALAAPVVLSQFCHTMFHVVDLMWVGRLGAAAIAAVSTCIFVLWTVYSLGDLAAVGLAATVSRHVGAGEREQAGYAAAQGLALALALALGLIAAGVPLARPLFAFLGTAPDVADQAVRYLTIILIGAPAMLVYIACESIMRAAGDTRTPMLVIIVSLVLNALLDPVLIFGWGPVPRLGVAGAAIATVFAQVVAVAWFLILALRGHPGFPLDVRALGRPSLTYALGLARIGAPFFVTGALFSTVYLFLAQLAARFGTAAVAIVGVANRIESAGYLVAVGFGLATETAVGQNLGARQPQRAERAAWLATGVMAALSAVFSVALLAWPEAFLRVFSSDAEVIRQGAPYLRVLALSQVLAAEVVLNGAFSGAGDTVPTMVISVPVSLARIPLAWWAAEGLGWGLQGIGWTITGTCALRVLFLAFWFRRGAWKTKQLATAPAAAAAAAAARLTPTEPYAATVPDAPDLAATGLPLTHPDRLPADRVSSS